MSFTQELSSWMSYGAKNNTSKAPEIGQQAPSSEKLRVPSSDGKAQVIVFLRHCGCPFAEKTFKLFRDSATKHPDVRFIAVSHSNQEHTQTWLNDVGGDKDVQIIVDDERELYQQWGLGPSSFMHVLSPAGFQDLYKLGKQENIWNRPTVSGSRWQTGGSFGVDQNGKLVWGGASAGANEIPDFEEVVKTVTK